MPPCGMAKETVKFPARISVPMTKQMASQIRAYAVADGNRPAANWIRMQLEKLLEQLGNGAKR